MFFGIILFFYILFDEVEQLGIECFDYNYYYIVFIVYKIIIIVFYILYCMKKYLIKCFYTSYNVVMITVWEYRRLLRMRIKNKKFFHIYMVYNSVYDYGTGTFFRLGDIFIFYACA